MVTDTLLSVHEQLFLAPLFAKSKIITCFCHLPNKTRESFMARCSIPPGSHHNLPGSASAATRCVTKDGDRRSPGPYFALLFFTFRFSRILCCCTTSHRSVKNDNVPWELPNYMQVSTMYDDILVHCCVGR
jgi:hypothetical protein